MEVAGTKLMFQRSIEKYQLRYTRFYGDGDSKSFPAVENIYEGHKVKKLECVGHVQKRVGTRLRKLKQEVKGIGGKGKLTNVIIDRLQNYYGIAIRSNVNNLEGMRSDILASLFHVASSKSNNWHSYCPTGESSWCKFNLDKVKSTSTYKPGAGLPQDIVHRLKPIYQNLSSTSLLEKYLHGKIQNQNESYNAMIWDRIPKTKYVSLPTFEFGVYDSVANFNIGRKASISVFEKLNMLPGRFTLKGCSVQNKKRLFRSQYRNKESSKIRRKVIRGKKKSQDDKNTDKEGTLYAAGSF